MGFHIKILTGGAYKIIGFCKQFCVIFAYNEL